MTSSDVAALGFVASRPTRSNGEAGTSVAETSADADFAENQASALGRRTPHFGRRAAPSWRAWLPPPPRRVQRPRTECSALLFAENPVTAKAVGAGLRARPPSPPSALPSLIISVGAGGEIMRAAFLRRPTMQSSASPRAYPCRPRESNGRRRGSARSSRDMPTTHTECFLCAAKADLRLA